MQPLRYSINVTLDGCCDHQAAIPSRELHEFAAQGIAEADALLYGRVIYGLMEAWRPPAETGVKADWMAEWMMPFARTIHKAKKYVVSDSLEHVDWNSELVRGLDLVATVERLKAEPGRGILTSGVRLPFALAQAGLIDEYEFIVHPVIAGHGPYLLAGLSQHLGLRFVGETQVGANVVARRYVPMRQGSR